MFRGNSARVNGGAIYIAGNSSPSLANCSFEENSAGSGGGAIHITEASAPKIASSTFLENSARSGGAIESIGSSLPILTNCGFQRNSAIAAGGAIYNYESSPELTNCSFQGNSSYSGGAIYNELASPTLTNCSFQGNSSITGGTIFNNIESFPTLRNCILWNNSNNGSTSIPEASIRNVESSATTYEHCLIQNLNLSGSGNLNGTNPLNNPRFVAEVDPLLPIAQRIGGDLRLLVNSPALDAGLDIANGSATDLAGNPRKDGTIDLGALEGFVSTYSLLWDTDFDLDGRSYGLEIANGTEPEEADRDPLGSFVFENGLPILRFSRQPVDFVEYAIKVMRSPDLSPGSFVEIFSITESNSGIDEEVGGGNQFKVGANVLVTFGDTDPPEGSAFYRFEIELLGP